MALESAPPHPPQPSAARARSCALALALATLAALASALPLSAGATEAGDAQPERQYAIAPGTLGDVLAQFAAQAGVPLSFDPRALQGLASPGLQGRHSVRDGFARLLAGSGHALVELGGGRYSLRRADTAPGRAAPVPAPAGQTPQLAPVLVTGTLYGSKETNSLGSSSASVGVVTAADIADGQIRSYRDAFRRLGNVMDAAHPDTGFLIRGINFEGFVPSGAPVGSLYVDGVLQTRDATRRGARGLWDVEQVEVYRGPQSTLSGRAAMAGAVYIKSRDPVFERQGEGSVTAGTHGLAHSAFMLNTPLSDQLAFRMAGEFERSDSPVRYPSFQSFQRAGELDSSRYYQLRGKLLLAPTASPSTLAVLSYAFTNDRPASRDIGVAAGIRLADRRGDFTIPAYVELRPTQVQNLGLEVTHEFSPALRLTSLTGLNRSLLQRRSVNQGTPGEINAMASNQKNLLATQELRLNYEAGRLKWVAGMFASREQYDSWLDRTLFSQRNDAQTFDTRTTNLALFGELSWEFVPSYRIVAGTRLDYARIESDYINHRRQPLSARPVVSARYGARVGETNFVPKLGIAKQLDERRTLALTYSQGFRAGNFGYNTVTSQVYEYKPERADSLELSYKGRHPGDRLQWQANLFYTRYTDQQVEMRLHPTDPFYREITNAASSRAWGLELEPSWRASERFTAFASLAYLNTRFKEFNHYQYGNLSGQPFPEAPEWTLALGGRYVFANGWYAGADARFTSGYLVRFGTPPQERLGGRTIVNLQAGYRARTWEVNAFAENLSNKRYYTGLDLSTNASDYASLGQERRVGIHLKMKF